jgi:hypothetical protein
MEAESEIGARLIKTVDGFPDKWDALVEVARNPEDPFIASFSVADDGQYLGKSAAEVAELLGPDSGCLLVFIADERALTEEGFPCVVLDMLVGPDTTFRATAENLASIENNLSIANMGFEEFHEAAGADGVFRGF